MSENSETLPGPLPAEEDEISLLDLLIVLAKHKRLVAGLPVAAGIVAAIVALLMPNVYTATARILPPQQGQSSAAAMLGQLGGLAGIAGGALGIKSPADLYIGMLKSRTVADSLIARFDLKKIYDQETMQATRKALESKFAVTAGKDGIIAIEVDDLDPKRAAAMAGGFIEELTKLTQTLAITEASQRRLFFEKQLKQAKQELADAEIGLKQTQETTGLIKLDDQGRAIIEAVAQLKAQVAAKEVQIGAMRTFAAAQNPDLVRAQQELAGLKGQLAKSERNNQALERGNILVPTGKIPEAGLEYLRKLRDVKYYETIFELLAKQYEIAKIDEARDTSIVQVLDPAIEPEKKSKPKRTLIVLLSALAAGFIAVIWAFVKEAGERARQNPQQAERLDTLRRYLRGK